MRIHFNTKTLLILFLSAWVGALEPVYILQDTYEAPSNDLMLRLGDPVQEARTASVNLGVAKKEVEWVRFSEKRPRAMRVVIDPGHGGRDLGALGHFGTVEKELCLRISRIVKMQLERQSKMEDFPLEVILSRDADKYLALGERVREANSWRADVFVSIHANSSEHPQVRGYEVYFLSAEASDAAARLVARKENRELIQPRVRSAVLDILSDVQSTQHVSHSSQLAETVYQALSQNFRANGRGVKQAPFTVLAGTEMPSILVEVGYVTHSEETASRRKGRYLKKLASAISAGIVNYMRTLKPLG